MFSHSATMHDSRYVCEDTRLRFGAGDLDGTIALLRGPWPDDDRRGSGHARSACSR